MPTSEWAIPREKARARALYNKKLVRAISVEIEALHLLLLESDAEKAKIIHTLLGEKTKKMEKAKRARGDAEHELEDFKNPKRTRQGQEPAAAPIVASS